MSASPTQHRTGLPSKPTGLRPDSLAYALDGAARAIGMLRAGTALPAALASVHAMTPPGAARGAIQDIAYRTTRRLALADAWLASLVRKAPPAHVGDLLRCAFALLADDEPRRAYPAFTIVDQAVDAIAARRDLAYTKGLVNAVLRNALRSRAKLIAEAAADPVTDWNYPRWWIDAVRDAWAHDAQRVLAVGNEHAPMTLRVNRRRTDVDGYLAMLREAGMAALRNAACGETAVTLREPSPVDALPGFADGVVSVQDAGAQCAAGLLRVRDGMRVLDACAAPGGKTGHLLESADIELVALESDAARAARIDENLARLGLSASVIIGDAGRPDTWHDARPFDRILADVPCSASGIVRRHPDVRWLRRASDIAALVDEQRRIVQALWPLLARGGELLYVTCSIFPDEGERQAQWFERVLEDAVRLDAPGQLLPTVAGPRDLLDDRCGAGSDFDHDGFFYARFQKR